jgi:hypothetical protein
MNREAKGKDHFGASDASNEPAAGPIVFADATCFMFRTIFNSLLGD